MLDVSYRRSLLDQDTQRLDVSRYLTCETAEDPVRLARRTQRVAAGPDATDPLTSD
ncbi:hypothetical protein IU486_13620 [Streptomyces gardneri]|uniref:hypothetical protein n=1 Tax=Nocardia TaxID=1817 RepID=UPI001357F406|nr:MULTISPECIES: hypothetical protein [Nocardia]MBF6165809.1 hypothetical protein [Streptomyces gardneri]MBF6203132.1 hypothetical protein [Streptomyces gardneri]UAK29990.1 hypothetical protein K8O92_18640 [Nocardia asteroides]